MNLGRTKYEVDAPHLVKINPKQFNPLSLILYVPFVLGITSWIIAAINFVPGGTNTWGAVAGVISTVALITLIVSLFVYLETNNNPFLMWTAGKKDRIYINTLKKVNMRHPIYKDAVNDLMSEYKQHGAVDEEYWQNLFFQMNLKMPEKSAISRPDYMVRFELFNDFMKENKSFTGS